MDEVQNVNKEQAGTAEPTAPITPQDSQFAGVPEDTPSQKSANLLIVVVLAVIVVILALMYLWGQSTAQLPPAPPAPDVVASDDVDVLEQDLVVPELDTLDSELDQLEAELNAELESL